MTITEEALTSPMHGWAHKDRAFLARLFTVATYLHGAAVLTAIGLGGVAGIAVLSVRIIYDQTKTLREPVWLKPSSNVLLGAVALGWFLLLALSIASLVLLFTTGRRTQHATRKLPQDAVQVLWSIGILFLLSPLLLILDMIAGRPESLFGPVALGCGIGLLFVLLAMIFTGASVAKLINHPFLGARWWFFHLALYPVLGAVAFLSATIPESQFAGASVGALVTGLAVLTISLITLYCSRAFALTARKSLLT